MNVGPYRPPPDGEQVRELMARFVRWFNEGSPTGWDPVVRAIVAHFYVVSIHPFGDGNGRTARAVESFLLYRAGVNARGYYSLANYYYQHRDQYIHSMNDVQLRGSQDLTGFVVFRAARIGHRTAGCLRRGYAGSQHPGVPETTLAAPWRTPAAWARRPANGSYNC